MLTATGNINEAYDVIGVVHAVASRTPPSTGCGGPGGLPVQEAYGEVTATLQEAARRSGGDGIIHIGYDYRLTSRTTGCTGTQTSVFEVYGWGTAIKLRR
ncbi:hypothetical protein ACTZWW_17015 [Salinarimonas sp. NSM]|uniref:hypothetical protein n=1 Tax=Salinarimonas sp. NSM TaxID=3458003 RepID=UPI0040359E5E